MLYIYIYKNVYLWNHHTMNTDFNNKILETNSNIARVIALT